MKRLSLLFVCFQVLILFAPPVAAQDAMPKTMAYQGYLTNTAGDPANGSTSVTFRLYDQPSSGSALWSERQQGVQFEDGVFAVHLGSVESLEGVLFNRPLWLGVSVDGGQELRPRVALEAVPFALSVQGLRTLPGGDPDLAVPNMILGHEENGVEEGVSGAVISGGGGEDFEANEVSASYGTVSGGNTNRVSGFGGAVAGGAGNQAEGTFSTVAGGSSNRAEDTFSNVAGGISNRARGIGSAVGGGGSNEAEGEGSTVPGGISNRAAGNYSFAAGVLAQAEHAGTFVWSGVTDNNSSPFSSTGELQFLIRADGGVGIGTNAPQSALHVTDEALSIDANDFSNDALVIEGDKPVIGIYASFQGNTRPGLVLAGVDNGSVVDKWGIVREYFQNNRLLFTYGLNEDHTQNATVMSLSSNGPSADQFTATRDLGSDGRPTAGGYFRDNAVYAWARVNADGTVASSYGCTVSKTATGSYTVTYRRDLPNGASAIVTPHTVNDPIIATATAGTGQASVATKVFDGAKFVPFDSGFYIQVVGRP